jgi:dinuclear metal center YbgI/SA1388 family protein
MNLHEITTHLQQIAPLDLAADWDNVGLLLGNADADVRRVLTCLSVTPAVAAEAVERGAQLMVTHHPILFRAVKRLTTTTSEGRMLLALATANVAVYSAHTAYDNCPGGINDLTASRLGLVGIEPLRRHEERQCKIVVFVTDKDLGKVSGALFAEGAGRIGQYNECSFRLAGTGTFFGTDSTSPTVGQKGRREDVSEWRLEVICPEPRVDAVVRAMRRAHSYEEPAYDVYALRPSGGKGGEGRVGRLAQPLSLGELGRAVKAALGATVVQIVGDAERRVERMAIVCGAGGELLSEALAVRADAFLTGELRFHDYLKAEAHGLGLVLPGHYASERFGMEELAVRLHKTFPGLEVWASRQELDPVQFVVGS